MPRISWRESTAGLLDIILGVSCLQCGKSGVSWCGCCLASAWLPHTITTSDGRLRVVAATHYGGSVQRALIFHKERGQLSLVQPLGRLLASAVFSMLWEVTLGSEAREAGRWRPPEFSLVPCPSSAEATRMRGQDHAYRLAASAVRTLRSWELPANLAHPISITRSLADQVGLSPEQRRHNVADAFECEQPRTSSRDVLVVDDVTTSGATLSEASRALAEGGWTVRGGAVVASAARRHTDPFSGLAGEARKD